MKELGRGLSIVFAAGALGGLVNTLVVWIFGKAGAMQSVGVTIAPELTLAWLYPRIVWGGMWGVLFLVPILGGKSTFLRGLVISLGPTLAQLLYFFPYKAGKGMLGLELGTLTPLFVLFFNAVWGWTGVWWIRTVGGVR